MDNEKRYQELMAWKAARDAKRQIESSMEHELHLLAVRKNGAVARGHLVWSSLALVLLLLFCYYGAPRINTRVANVSWVAFSVAALMYCVEGMMALEMQF